MFKLLLGLVLLLNSSMLLSAILPGGTSCQGRSMNVQFTIIPDQVPVVAEAGCYKTTYKDATYEIEGVMCVADQDIFLSFPRGDDWTCKLNYQTRQWRCTGIGSRNRNKVFSIICR